jgi:hypothetical protein
MAPPAGQGAQDQAPKAGGTSGVALTQPTSPSAADELFAAAITNPLTGAVLPARHPARVAPEPPALPPASGGAPAGAAVSAAVGQAVNGGPAAAPASGAQGGANLAALRSYAGLPAAPQAEGAGPAGASPSPREQAPAVHARFDAFNHSEITVSPFPSNRFTVADDTQNTGLQVRLPLPDPATNLSNYQDTQVLNQLDGFNIQPRLSIPFDGPIDVNSVNSQDVFLINLGDTVDHLEHGSHTVGINQIVWDPATTTLHAESDQLLDQHTRYALIVTNGVHDATGQPVQASADFARFRHDLNFGQTKDPALKEYRQDLLEGTEAAELVGVPASDIVTASVFTTQSTTAVLEKIRDQIDTNPNTPAPVANFNVGVNGEHTVFSLSQVAGITLLQQTTVGGQPTPVTPAPPTLSMLRAIPGAVSQVAYGKYSSPDFEKHPDGYIPAVGTRTGVPAILGTNDLYFDLYLPSGPRPVGGWPVAIFGHGASGNKDGTFGVAVAAAEMAAKGIATIGINVVGHGFGPGGTLTVSLTGDGSVTLPAGGRGIDQNGDGKIEATEGFSTSTTSPQAIISQRDARVQTVADLMQLVRVIQAGVSVNGDGKDLDPSHIYYVGASLGGMVGAAFLAVEPSVTAGALNNLGGPNIEINRLRPSRGDLGTLLTSRVSLPDNGPGITSVAGRAVNAPYFNENLPLRDGVPLTVGLANGTTQVIQSPVTNNVPVAMAIQQVFDNWEWVSQPGNPVAYAPYLREDPLPGVPAKSVIIQFAKGDQNVENPTTTAFLRAGNLEEQATYYRHDLVFAENPGLPASLKNPHTFLGQITSNYPAIIRDIAWGAQAQIAEFFASDGTDTIHPSPERFFETPIQGPLPEGLNYIV